MGEWGACSFTREKGTGTIRRGAPVVQCARRPFASMNFNFFSPWTNGNNKSRLMPGAVRARLFAVLVELIDHEHRWIPLSQGRKTRGTRPMESCREKYRRNRVSFLLSAAPFNRGIRFLICY